MRISLFIILLLHLICICSWSQQSSDLGVFDATAYFGFESEFAPQLGVHKIPGRVEVNKINLNTDEAYSLLNIPTSTIIPFVFFIIHLFTYVFYPKQTQNLVFSIFMLSIAILYYLKFYMEMYVSDYSDFSIIIAFFSDLSLLLGLLFCYYLTSNRMPRQFLYLLLFVIVYCLLCFITPNEYLEYFAIFDTYIHSIFLCLIGFEGIRCLINAIRQKIEGIYIFIIGIIPIFIVEINSMFVIVEDTVFIHDFSFIFLFVSLSIYVSLKSAITSKNLEILNAELEDRVEQRTAELKTTQDKLIQSEKMASLGQLVAGVAHEINNPITFIKSNIEPLKSYLEGYKRLFVALGKNVDSMSTELRNDYTSIQKEEDLEFAQKDSERLLKSFEDGSNRISKIVNDLRQYIQVDANYQSLYDIHEAIDSCVDLLQSRMDDRIIVHKSFGDIPSITCSPGQINQVFMNILSNAVDAIKEKGNIWISTQREANNVVIQIRDDGKGIPEDIKTKIYDPFFTTKLVGQGTGLGLSIAHSIVEQHRGDITVKSEMGIGTKFYLILPINNQTE